MQASAQRRFTVRRQSTVGLISSPTAASRYNANAAAGGAVTRRPASPGSGSGRISPQSCSFEGQWGADDDDDVDPDKPLTCAERIAFPFVWLYKRLFVDLRESEDDFDTILRKIVISAGVPLVVFPVTFALYLASELAQTEITVGGLVTLIVMFVFPLVWIPAFLYVRHTKEVPFALIDTWLIATTLGVGVLTVSLIEYPTPQLAFFLLVMAMLCRTPRVVLHVFLLTGVYGTAMANQAISGLNPVTEEPLATVPDPYRGSLLERVAYQITGMFIGAIIASAVIMQTRENARMMARSATAAVVARQVANQLATYDTDAAKETLRGFARGNRAEVDLTSAFYAIVENLELYQPHLPGWIMQAHEEERQRARDWAEGGEGHLEPFDFAGQQQDPLDSSAEQYTPTNGGAGTRQHRQRQRRMRRAAAANDPDLDLEVDIRIESVSNSPSDGRLSPSDNGSLDGGGGGNNGGVVVRRSGAPPNVGGGPQSRTPMMASLLNASSATRAFFGKATFAMLHVDMKLSPAESMTPAYDKLIDACCTRLHEVCAVLHGIVHSIAGDTVLMSWNAISRTAVPETKCAKAMAQLVTWSGDSDVTISGMAITDYVRCHHYGATSKLFGARLPHKNTLWAVSLYARDRQAMLVDETAFRTAHGDVEMFPADVLRVQDWRSREVTDMSAGPSPKNPTTNNNGRFSAQNSPSVNASLHAHTTQSTERSLGGASTLTAPPSGLRSPNTGLGAIQPPSLLNRGNSTLSASMQRGNSMGIEGMRDMRVYEVIREHPSEATEGESRSLNHTASEHSHGDEWMYVLQRRARGGARRGSGGSTMSEAVDPIDIAIRHAMRGRYTEALEHVKDFIKQLSTAADTTAFSDNGTGAAPPPGSIDEAAGGSGPLSDGEAEPDLNATGKRNSGSSTGTDGTNDPPTHAHLNSTSGPFGDLPAPLQISTGGNDGKVPPVVLRLKQRLQQLIAIKAGPEDFPTLCVLGYGGNWAAFDASPVSHNLLTPAASFTTSKQRRSSAQES